MKKIIEWLYLHQKGNLAYYDKLTQLLNRNWWEIEAKKTLNSKHLFLTIADLDNLKKVNDTHGHLAGDALINIFAKNLKLHFPKEKIVRLGGDEFLIISEQKPVYGLRRLLLENFHFSYGIIEKTEKMTLTKALKEADKKMYKMKKEKAKLL